MKSTHITVLIFILILAIIFICNDLSCSSTIVVFIMAFLAINTNLQNAVKDLTKSSEGYLGDISNDGIRYPTFASHNPYAEKLDDTPPVKEDSLKDMKLFSRGIPVEKIQPILPERQYMQHQSYDFDFTGIVPITSMGQPLIDSSIDSANCEMVREMTRDKRKQTSATIKDANFYKQYYGNEFDETEKRIWWGNSEF